MKVAFDLDGTVLSSIGVLSRFAYDELGKNIDYDKDSLGLDHSEEIRVTVRIAKHLALINIHPYAGALELTRLLAKHHEIFYITNRITKADEKIKNPILIESIVEQTKECLEKWEFPHRNNLIFSKSYKSDDCFNLDIDFIVEDRLKIAQQCNNLKTTHGKITKALLIDRPWNQGYYPNRCTNYDDIFYRIVN